MFKQLLLLFCFLLNFTLLLSAETESTIKIGVLAKRGIEQCYEQWLPTAEYLNSKILEHKFEIIALNFEEVYNAVENEEVEFILANSSYYIELEMKYGVNRIATLKNLRIDKSVTTFGGVVFYRSDRKDIQSIKDLKGKIFSAADENSFGGWQMAWGEFVDIGIDPYEYFSEINFPGTHDSVVYSVLNGTADAGTVRTDALERMDSEGKISLEDFSILTFVEASNSDFPFLLSTRLYPEWPMARVKHTNIRLAEIVTAALIGMQPEDEAAKSAQCAGWTVPLNYQPVHDILKILQVGPYSEFGKISISEVIHRYYLWIIGFIILFAMSILVALYVLNLNGKLGKAIKTRDLELEKRLETETQLQKALDQNQILLNKRTTDLYESDKALQGEMVLCHTLLNSIQAGVMLWDSCARLITLNPVAEQILGISLKNIKNKNIKELTWSLVDESGRKLDIQEYPVSKVIATEKPVFDFVAGSKKSDRDNIVWIIANARPLFSDKNILDRILVVFMDITERRQTQEYLIQTEKMISIGGIAAGMAHEINNPLAGMIQTANVINRRIRDKKLPANLLAAEKAGTTMEAINLFFEYREILHMMDVIIESGHRAAEIIENMLSFARKSNSAISTCSPDQLMDKILELASTDYNLKKKYDFKAIRIEKKYEKDLPMILCDKSKIQQVILNILQNGAQAMYEYRRETSYQPCLTLKMFSEKNTGMFHIEIGDNGPGMDEATRRRIFEPFYTTKPVGIGTGLGLSISYFIITKNHGGTLNVESEPGKGTNFIIRLPLK